MSYTIIQVDNEGEVNSITTEGKITTLLTTSEPETIVIESNRIGPQGIPGQRGEVGPPGETAGLLLVYQAGQILSGHRMVVLNADHKAIYADRTVVEHATKVLGMTTGAAILDDYVYVLTRGELVEPSWSWTLDTPVWLNTSGLLTQTVPTVGFSLIIGFPISSTKIFIDIREPIFLL